MRQHETQTHRYLRDNLPVHVPEATITHNKVLVATKYRPDFVIQQQCRGQHTGDVCVVLEVDENGHALYDTDRETKREDEIMRCLINRGMRPVLIRFDPAPHHANDRPPARLASRLRMLLDIIVRELVPTSCHNMVTRLKKTEYKKITLY